MSWATCPACTYPLGVSVAFAGAPEHYGCVNPGCTERCWLSEEDRATARAEREEQQEATKRRVEEYRRIARLRSQSFGA